MQGIPLGILIGLITGIVALFLFRTAWNTPSKRIGKIITLTGELLSIPTFWFGGPWLTTKMFESIKLEALLSSYLISLACTFTPIALFILAIMMIKIGNEFWRTGGNLP